MPAYTLPAEFVDQAAERALLAAIAHRPELYWEVADYLPTGAFVAETATAEDLLTAIDQGAERLPAVPEDWVPAEDLKLPVKRLLGFKGSGEWWEFAPFDGWLATEAGRAGLARLFEALCKAREMTAEETWGWLRRRAELDRDKARQAYERRLWEEERVRLLVALPREEALERVLRYEAHLSRLFARTLEELERVRGLTRREREHTPAQAQAG